MSKIRLIGGDLVPLVKQNIAPKIKVLDIFRPGSLVYLGERRNINKPILFPKTTKLFIRHSDAHYFYYTAKHLPVLFPKLRELYLYNVPFDAEPMNLLAYPNPDFKIYYVTNHTTDRPKYSRLSRCFPDIYTQLDAKTYSDSLKEFEQFEEIYIDKIVKASDSHLKDELGASFANELGDELGDENDYKELGDGTPSHIPTPGVY